MATNSGLKELNTPSAQQHELPQGKVCHMVRPNAVQTSQADAVTRQAENRSVEQSICQARASVMVYDDTSKKWVPIKPGQQGFSRINIYHNTATNTFRVVGVKLQDQQAALEAWAQSAEAEHKLWEGSQSMHNRGQGSLHPPHLFPAPLVMVAEDVSATSVAKHNLGIGFPNALGQEGNGPGDLVSSKSVQHSLVTSCNAKRLLYRKKYTLKTCPGDFAVSLESEERRRHLKNSETCLARLYVELGQEQTVVLQAPWVLQQATLSPAAQRQVQNGPSPDEMEAQRSTSLLFLPLVLPLCHPPMPELSLPLLLSQSSLENPLCDSRE
ncbi:Ena/VASP-like protein [Aix galericulata]|nr:Ena/VASP-like protein [Aix galericulata]